MVKSAASNAAQKPPAAATAAAGASSAAAGVPTNMAAGTANNPLAALTGARYAGHVNLPSMDMFGADAGVSPEERRARAQSSKLLTPPSRSPGLLALHCKLAYAMMADVDIVLEI